MAAVQDLMALSPTEQRVLKALVMASPEEYDRVISQLRSIDFKIEPVSPLEFLFDEEYLGKSVGDIIWDPWVEPLTRVMDPRNEIYEWILTGAIGAGKTTVAIAAMTYRIYCLACMRDPYGFFEQSIINRFFFAVFNLFKYKGEDLYEKLKTAINTSPWFQKNFPVNPRLKDKLEFPRHVTVVAGASEIETLGENLMCCHMSEVNFMRLGATREELGQAWKIYQNVGKRIKSRYVFQGYTPGLMILDSSRRARTDFIEKHLDEVRDDPHVLVTEGALWDFKPRSKFLPTHFVVALGDERRMSWILKEGEKAPADVETIEVPDDFRKDFERDMDGSCRDIAGIATHATSKFIRDPAAVAAAVDLKAVHPFTQDEVVLGTKDSNELIDFLARDRYVTVQRGRYVPRYGHGKLRYAHVDLAASGDSAGFAMGYVENEQWVTRRRADVDIVERQLMIRVEMMMKINPPMDGQIAFVKIRRFIYALRDLGVVFGLITYDGWQSIDSIQELLAAGFNAKLLSIDKVPCNAYQYTREALVDRRLKHYPYPFFSHEMLHLERDNRTGKIDHPQGGAKDISDAVAGVVHNCTTSPSSASRIPDPVFEVPGGESVPLVGVPVGKVASFPVGQLLGRDYRG